MNEISISVTQEELPLVRIALSATCYYRRRVRN